MSDSFFDWSELESDDSKPTAMPNALREAFDVVAKNSEFFDSFARGQRYIRDDSLPAVMATDCVDTVYYNGAMIESRPNVWNATALAGVIAHELMHILRNDAAYADTYGNKEYANIAMDAIINRDLFGHGARRGTWIRPLIPRDPTKSRPKQGFECMMEADSQFETTISAYRKVESVWSKAEKQDQKNGQPKRESNGDLLMDKHAERLAELGGEYKAREKVEAQARMSYEQAKANAEAAQAQGRAPNNGMTQNVAEHGQKPDGFGLNEGGAQRELEAMGIVSVVRPIVKIARVAGAVVRGMIRSKTQRVSSSMVPSAMSALHGRIIPGRRKKSEFNFAIAIDCSGSVSHERLQLFTESARQWVTQFQSRGRDVQVCFFDTSIKEQGTMREFRDPSTVPNSGGGTDFLPVFRDWLPNIPKPTHLIIFTDTQGRWPDSAPNGIRVINIIPEEYRGRLYSHFGDDVFAPM